MTKNKRFIRLNNSFRKIVKQKPSKGSLLYELKKTIRKNKKGEVK